MITNIIAAILGAIGIFICIFSIFSILYSIFDLSHKKGIDCYLFMFIFGFMLQIPSIVLPVTNITKNSINPEHISKTNDMTFVYWQIDNRAGYYRFEDAKYWNATNIMIEFYRGRNIYGFYIFDNVRAVIK